MEAISLVHVLAGVYKRRIVICEDGMELQVPVKHQRISEVQNAFL